MRGKFDISEINCTVKFPCEMQKAACVRKLNTHKYEQEFLLIS